MRGHPERLLTAFEDELLVSRPLFHAHLSDDDTRPRRPERVGGITSPMANYGSSPQRAHPPGSAFGSSCVRSYHTSPGARITSLPKLMPPVNRALVVGTGPAFGLGAMRMSGLGMSPPLSALPTVPSMKA